MLGLKPIKNIWLHKFPYEQELITPLCTLSMIAKTEGEFLENTHIYGWEEEVDSSQGDNREMTEKRSPTQTNI